MPEEIYTCVDPNVLRAWAVEATPGARLVYASVPVASSLSMMAAPMARAVKALAWDLAVSGGWTFVQKRNEATVDYIIIKGAFNPPTRDAGE